MSEPNRQLAAIMFTDIVGYTNLMGRDEKAAVKLLEKNRSLHKSILQKFKGKLIKEMGDGMIASFNTASNAVLCAKNIQDICLKESKIPLRIGIHLGEVLFEGDDVFGDGVNIASRIESLTPVGSIYITESVARNVENQKEIRTEFIGEKVLKNVKHPVKIYQVKTEVPSSFITSEYSVMASFQSTEKSIAVLPFINVSSDPEQEYFSDGLTDEIITDLSKLKNLLVISRNSMMTYKGTQKKSRDIAAEVNVRYLLEGSVRKAENNLKITAQLIDVMKDNYLWTEKYRGTIEDIFEIQEKVSSSIVTALEMTLTSREEQVLLDRPIQNIHAYDFYIRGLQEAWKYTERGYLQAIAFLNKSLELTGENAFLYGTLSIIYTRYYHYCIPDPTLLQKAAEYGEKSLDLDPNNSHGQYALAFIEWVNGNLQESCRLVKKVLEQDPNNPEALQRLSVTYALVGWSKIGVPIARRLVKVDPVAPVHEYFLGFIEAGFWDGNIKESLPSIIRWYEKEPDALFCRFWKIVFHALLDMKEECVNAANLMIRDTPDLVFGKFAGFMKHAIIGEKKEALKYLSEETKAQAATMDFMNNPIAFGYLLIDEEEEALNWMENTIKFGYGVYDFFKKLYDDKLEDNERYQRFLAKIKERKDTFEL